MFLIKQSIQTLKIMAEAGQIQADAVAGFLETVHTSLLKMKNNEEKKVSVSVESTSSIVAPEIKDETSVPEPKTKASSEVSKTPEPVISIEESVRDDAVVCMICGKTGQTLKRHIGTAHQMDEIAYRKNLGLAKDHPLVSPAYSRKRSETAKSLGLGEKMQAGRRAKKGKSSE